MANPHGNVEALVPAPKGNLRGLGTPVVRADQYVVKLGRLRREGDGSRSGESLRPSLLSAGL
jgi:hypothetical protein